MKIRIVIADDHHLVRQGIRVLLEASGLVEIIGEAADGVKALELTQKLQPDVLVLDINMPRMTGVEVVEKLQKLNVLSRIVVLSMHSESAVVKKMLSLGVKGYLLKQSVAEDLLEAIQKAHRDETFISPLIEITRPNQNPIEKLTDREKEVWKLIIDGKTNRGIAHQLSISVKTVEKHRASLMDKLDVRDTASLVKVAIDQGLFLLD